MPDASLVLVDTDVFSFFFRGDSRAERYRLLVEGSLAALSFQTVAELYQGALQAGWGERRRNRLRDEIGRYLAIPFNMEMVELWARIRSSRRAAGREVDAADAWVAATALWAQCPVVTHNQRDFEGIDGLSIITL